MGILKYRNGRPVAVNDDLADILFDWWEYPFGTSSITIGGRVYDPDKYDLVPKKEWKEKLVESKQKEIDSLEEKRKKLEEELRELKKGL